MRQRALIHVDGPKGSGKTVFVEALLAARGNLLLAARCVRQETLRRARESSPPEHPELQRYRRAGAYAAALFTFPSQNADPIAFFESDLMLNYSEGVILEGDNPAVYADLEVFVAPVPEGGESLYVRQQRDVASEERAKADTWEALLKQPDGMAKWMEEMVGVPMGGFLRKNPVLGEGLRTRMLAGIAAIRKSPPPKPVQHWAVSQRFRGIERAGLVVVNIRDEAERAVAQQLVGDVHRLRRDDALFKDILGWRGYRLPITAVVANLADPGDAGRRKAVARVRRAVRAQVR